MLKICDHCGRLCHALGLFWVWQYFQMTHSSKITCYHMLKICDHYERPCPETRRLFPSQNVARQPGLKIWVPNCFVILTHSWPYGDHENMIVVYKSWSPYSCWYSRPGRWKWHRFQPWRRNHAQEVDDGNFGWEVVIDMHNWNHFGGDCLLLRQKVHTNRISCLTV